MRRFGLAFLVLLVTACGHAPTRRSPSPESLSAPQHAIGSTSVRSNEAAANACAPTREHHDSDYTPGGLYAPGVADGGPAASIDVSGVLEPVPRAEPRSRYGNRSPYSVLGKSYRVLDSADGYRERGVASWYGTKFNGRATSSGELYDMCAFSAAHKTLPLPSFVRVTNLDNGRSLIVRVNDRGPFHSGRIMDLSYAAAVRLGVDRTGTARVELQAVAGGEGAESAASSAWGGLGKGGEAIVQVGSFAENANARRLADRLQDAGVDDVDVDHAQIDGQDLWRVRIGPVSPRDLPGLLEHLRQLDLPNPRVFSE